MPNRTYALEWLNIANRNLETAIDDIITISDYYETDRYPGPKYFIPSREEVDHYFLFAEQLFKRIDEFINS